MDRKKQILFVATFFLLLLSAGSAAADNITHGKTLYVINCLRCHGPKGMGGIGKKLEGDAAYWDFAVFKRTVMTGVDDQNKQMKTMPVFGKTGFTNPHGVIPNDTDLHDIQAYLKSFGAAE